MTLDSAGIAPSCQRDLQASLARIRAGETDGVEELQGLHSNHPDELAIMGPLAWAVAIRGEHEEAIALYERYSALQPENVEVRWRIGDRLVNLHRLDEAEAAYRMVVQDHPDCQDAAMGVRYIQHLRRKDAKPEKSAPYVPTKRSHTDLQRENGKLNRTEYKEQKTRLESLPSDLFLESTTKCNFFCKTCSKGYDHYHAEDLREPVRELVRRELMPVNTRISITGFGEPTLAADFDDILEMSVENGSFVHFVTNASLLNFERLEKLAQCPVSITISFDGGTKKTFEEIRAGSNFERTLEKLAMIKKVRDIYLSKAYSHFSFNFVALRQNIHELPEVLRIAHRYGITAINVADYGYNFTEFDENSLRFDAARANRYLEESRALAKELGILLQTPPPYQEALSHVPPSHVGFWKRLRAVGRFLPEPNRFPRKCSSPWSEPYITTDGIVAPCCSARVPMGDLAQNSFAKVWNGWRYRLLRLRIHSALPPVYCRRCFVIWGINGGNAGNVMAKEGLLVKAFYWLEVRLHGLAYRAGKGWQKVAARLRGKPLPVEPEPNYYMGRPMKKDKAQASLTSAP